MIHHPLTLTRPIQIVQLTLQLRNDQFHIFIASASQRFHPLLHLGLGLGAQEVRAIVDAMEDDLEAILFTILGEFCSSEKDLDIKYIFKSIESNTDLWYIPR